jgi:hypothetical protein
MTIKSALGDLNSALLDLQTADYDTYTAAVFIPFNRDFAEYVRAKATARGTKLQEASDFQRVFIVHGHEEGPRETIARFLTTTARLNSP